MTNFFYLVWSLVPLAVFGRLSSDQYFIGKWLVYFLFALACLPFLFFKKKAGVQLRLWAPALGAMLIFRLASWNSSLNTGYYLFSCASILAVACVLFFVDQTDLKIPRLGKLAVIQSFALVFPSLVYAFTGYVLFQQEYFLGGTIGNANTLSIYLAQLVPFVLLVGASSEPWLLIGPRLAGIALFLNIVTICLMRTRSAWMMLALYAFAAFYALSRSRKSPTARTARTYLLALGLAIGVVALVPNHLRWKTSNPYLDSLSTVASLEASNGRDEVWRVARLMFLDSPVRGAGSGQFPVLFGKYALEPGIDRTKIKSQGIECAYNEYIQAAAETGIPGALAMLAFVLLLPAYGLWASARRSGSDLPLALLSLSALATAINAFVDDPLQRPCSMIGFALALGLVYRGKIPPAWLRLSPERVRGVIALFGTAALLIVGTVFARLGTYYVLAEYLTIQGQHGLEPDRRYRLFELDHSAWPWADDWQRGDLVRERLKFATPREAEQLSEENLALWPESRDAWIARGAFFVSTTRYPDALSAFRKAFRPFGKDLCCQPCLGAYWKLLSAPDLPADLRLLSDDELGPCSVPLRKKISERPPVKK